MSYEASFAPEFWCDLGEPYDTDELCINAQGKPYTVWSAIERERQRDSAEFRSWCEELFPGIKPEHVTTEALLSLAQETNTVRNLTVPVEVYFNEAGTASVCVWDR